ncbi:MAG TPA: hypothetical protein VKB78_13040, partial [Pirellulales bacterium]|nr:hypothetical protein [Pirellulales bacterium]
MKRDLEDIQGMFLGGMGVKKFVEDMTLVGRTLRGVTTETGTGLGVMTRFAAGFGALGVGVYAATELIEKFGEAITEVLTKARSAKLTASTLGMDPVDLLNITKSIERIGGTATNVTQSISGIGKAMSELYRPGGGRLGFELMQQAIAGSEGAMRRFLDRVRATHDPVEKLRLVLQATENVYQNELKKTGDSLEARARANEFAGKLGVDATTAQIKEIDKLSEEEREAARKRIEAGAEYRKRMTEMGQAFDEFKEKAVLGGVSGAAGWWQSLGEHSTEMPEWARGGALEALRQLGGMTGSVSAPIDFIGQQYLRPNAPGVVPPEGVMPLFSAPGGGGGLGYPWNQMRQSTNIEDRRNIDEHLKALEDNTGELNKLNLILQLITQKT